MSEVKTSRPFQERFLDGYSRSELRREVQSVKPPQSGARPKKYATMALGVSLALSGISVPLNLYQSMDAKKRLAPLIARDLRKAEEIAVKLKVRVDNDVAAVSDQIRKDFFLKHVPFGSIIYSEATKNNVSPELVASVARAESGFHPTARSHRGAIGVMQLVPRTGRWMGATDLTDPTQNIVAGTKYLKYLSERFGGKEDHVIAAYNAGEGNVRRFDGVPPFSETRDYIQRVHRFQQDLRARMTGQVADAGLAAMPERSRPKIDIHWTRPEERRALKLKRVS
jgi:soluble lytic murein transglycosylase-like protein